ncbi:hypothetical protein GCM10010298_72360 [Streptomyces microflavus]|nr:hypothetical protein GCM10010298_72360 [Streptomyces microflavus]
MPPTGALHVMVQPARSVVGALQELFGKNRVAEILSPNPWCSDECFDQEVLQRSNQQECAACGTSIADRKPGTRRKWCSGTCQQRGFRWRAELRDRTRLVRERTDSRSSPLRESLE